MADKLNPRILNTDIREPKDISGKLEFDLNKEPEYKGLGGQLGQVLGDFTLSNTLSLNQAKYKAVFENASQAFLIISSDFTITDYNEAANVFWKLILNKPLIANSLVTDYLHPDKFGDIYDKLSKSFTGENIISEVSIDDFNGDNRYFQIHFSPISLEPGKVADVLVSIINISSHANQKIAILESITDGMFALDRDWNFTYVNAKAEKLIRRKRKELLGKNIWAEFKINEKSKFYIKYLQAVNEKKDVYFEEYSYFMGGWIEVHAYPSREGLSVYFRSINDRKEAEEKQKESEEWFKAVLATSRDGFAVELNEKLIYMNGAFLDLFGYSQEDAADLKNAHVSMFLPEDTRETILELGKKRVNDEPVPSIYETKAVQKNGKIIDVEISASVLKMKSNSYIIVLVRDITQRKISEVQILEQNEELLKINAELDRFVYSASHDLRAPLMSILGLINIARIETNQDLFDQYFNLMTKSVHKLDRFVQDIIDYSRNSRTEIKREEIALESLLKETLDEMKFMENADKIEKIVQVNQQVPFFSDKSRLNIIFNNLLSNSIRYSNLLQEKPFIKLSVDVSPEEARIIIEDNGQGIGEQHVEKIFDMFYRATEKNVGSGLGLYIVKETIAKIEGSIEVKSVLGKGTSFIITLPNLANSLEAPPSK